MIKNSIFFSVLSSLLFLSSPAFAHKAHEHGVAKVNIAVDGAQVTIFLESPLVDLLSFGHAPATLEQCEQVKEMARRMHQSVLFRLTPAAECRLERVALASEVLAADLLDPNISLPVLCPGQSAAQSSGEVCNDLHVEFTFICGKPENLSSVNVLLFNDWPKLTRIDAQAVTPKGQRSASLTPKRHLVSW